MSRTDIEFAKMVSGSAVWPPNRNFLYYFLYLWLKHGSLQVNIDNMSTDYASFLSGLVNSIPPDDIALLVSLSDCNIADQRLDIPIGWKNRPYRFFFGDLERPLAFMDRFIADFTSLDDLFLKKIGFGPSALLEFSLAHQDILIHELEKMTLGLDPNPSNSITVPPPEFIEQWWQCLRNSWSKAFVSLSPNCRAEVQIWLDNRLAYYKTAGQDQEVYESMMKLFPIIHSDDSYLILFPQMWLSHLINTFMEEAKKIWPDEPGMERLLSDAARIRTFHALANLKHQTPDAVLLTDVYLRRGQASSSEIDALLIVDTDKLVAIRSVAGIDFGDLEPRISEACTILSSVCDFIDKTSGSEELEIVNSGGKQTWALKVTSNFQAYPLMVINQLTLDPILANLENSPRNTQAFMLTDLEALSAEIEDTLDFVRFLRAILEIRTLGVQLIHADFLDLWAWYRDNGHNFLWSVRSHPNAVFIDPHWYSEKEMQTLAEKAAVRRLMITQGIPERCKFLRIDQNTVKLMDPISLIGITVRTSTMSPQTIMVHICSRESNSDDVGTNESLSESLLRRYEEVREISKELIELASSEAQERLVVWLYGEKTLRSSQALKHLRIHLDTNPLECVFSKGTLLRNEAIGVAIVYRDSLLEHMRAGTIEGELQLIKALLTGIELAVKAPPALMASLIKKLSISSKKGINVADIFTGHTWVSPHKPHVRSPAVTAQVTVEVSQMIASLNVKPGTYEGSSARELINYKIFPFLKDSLDKNMQDLRSIDIASWLYGQVENASAHYQIEHLRLGSAASALDIEFDLGEAASKVKKQSTQLIQAGGLVIERSAIMVPSGKCSLTREIGEHLLEYAMALLGLSQASEQDYYGLQKIRIDITDDYEFKLSMTDEIFDLVRWQSDTAAEDVGRERNSGRQKANRNSRQRFTDNFSELKIVDTEFRNQFKYGIDDILEVMVGLSHYPAQSTDAYFPLVMAKEEDLLQYFTTAILDFKLEQGEKPLAALSLEANFLKEDWRPWLLRGRKHRFATHPLFPLGKGQYLFGPWFVEHSCKAWLAYLSEGRLPLPDSLLSDKILNALQTFRNMKNRKLEDEVARIVDKLHLPKIGPRIQRPEELWGCCEGSSAGEIDLLVAVKDTKSLYVLEIKDPARTLVVDDIAGQIRDYYDDKENFQTKLERKHYFVAKHLSKILSSMNINASENWQAKAAFVTRYPIAAGYAKARKYPFLTLQNIDALKAL